MVEELFISFVEMLFNFVVEMLLANLKFPWNMPCPSSERFKIEILEAPMFGCERSLR